MNSEVYPSTTISIICRSSTPVKWSFNEEEMPQNARVYDYSTALTNIRLYNDGYYECKGTTSNGEIFLAEVRMIVHSKFIVLFIVVVNATEEVILIKYSNFIQSYISNTHFVT